MEKNTIIFNGKSIDTFIEKTSVKILYLLKKKNTLHYEDNPPVAAIVNGELKSLQDEITQNATIDLIYLDSKEGRKIYRKTLCFLLSYASAVLYPERTLVTGHSLGDGVYFSYRNKEKPDLNGLKKVMEDAIKDNMSIELETLSEDEALKHVRKAGLEETEKLILSRNDGSYTFSRLGKCLSLSVEPFLPCLGYLKYWDLMEYKDGLLLRYPQSRNTEYIYPFQDNPLLFSVFQKAKEGAEVLGVTSIGSLNEKQSQGKIRETVLLSETLQRENISQAAKEIIKKEGVKVVFIAGPTSSGKRTFSFKLCSSLSILGKECMFLSLDEYSKDPTHITIDNLDLTLLRSDVKTILNGGEIKKSGRILFGVNGKTFKENSILIIEGVQALNKDLFPFIKKEESFRIFLSALTQLNLDTRSGISTTDNREIRRLVKECRNGEACKDVLLSWREIEKEEKSQLFPFQNDADLMINSALEYEFGVLYTRAIPLLRSVKKEDGKAYTEARRLLSFLKLVYPIPSSLVPEDSILREFIGGSFFEKM